VNCRDFLKNSFFLSIRYQPPAADLRVAHEHMHREILKSQLATRLTTYDNYRDDFLENFHQIFGSHFGAADLRVAHEHMEREILNSRLATQLTTHDNYRDDFLRIFIEKHKNCQPLRSSRSARGI